MQANDCFEERDFRPYEKRNDASISDADLISGYVETGLSFLGFEIRSEFDDLLALDRVVTLHCVFSVLALEG